MTSKRYSPDESWTKEKAWWIQIPVSAVQAGRFVHIVCEADAPEQGFHHLQVPAEFLQSHLNDFALIGGDKINLFLAIDRGKTFQDQRGPGRVSFARFEQATSKSGGANPSAIAIDARAVDVSHTDDSLRVRLADGRELTVPLAWFPRLLGASNAQLERYQLVGGGVGIRWHDLDEDLSVEGLLTTR